MKKRLKVKRYKIYTYSCTYRVNNTFSTYVILSNNIKDLWVIISLDYAYVFYKSDGYINIKGPLKDQEPSASIVEQNNNLRF